MTKLVIVESPTKIKTLMKYLPSGFKVASSVGHIRDLPAKKTDMPKELQDKPWAEYGVNFENDFEPVYVVYKGKSKVVSDLKKQLKDADELYLATDEDREGESISWHLLEVLKPKVPVRRMVFNEITREAIRDALANPRDIDMHLVDAQETRRILDRLYGWSLSPLLWRKIGGARSAGRVQSVALRLLVDRERERRRFMTASYWDLKADLAKAAATAAAGGGPGGGSPLAAQFEGRLATVGGKPVATGKDFDKDTGALAAGKENAVVHLDEEGALALAERLKDEAWRVAAVAKQAKQSSPFAPFITSTLQQEGNNRLNLGARETMRIAQRLYEGGFITYMRTDSTTLSEEALTGARKAVADEFGSQYLSRTARTYEHKKAKGAQEAHEAIRPAGAEFQHPDRTGLSGKDLDLYRLIWQRTLASQMENERYTSTSVTVEAADTTFSATGKTVEFPGWRLAYPVTRDDDRELPGLAEGDNLTCREVVPEGHETKPPARYTEATLVRELEEKGIGRPSTYADTVDTLVDRDYAVRKGKTLVPTFVAFAVTGFLEKHFPKLVDYEFTAAMEEALDEIAAGDADGRAYLRQFFLGDDGLRAQVDERMESIKPSDARVIDFQGLPCTVRIGRFGPYIEAEIDGETVNASIPVHTTPDELTPELVEELARRKAEGPEALGKDPETGEKVFLLTGRFGPYVQLGEAKGKDKPPRASLPKGVAMEQVTIEDALFLLSLPRELGPHPDGGTVVAGLGRYGPYIAHMPEGEGKADYRNLADFDKVKTVTLGEALDMLRQPKGGRGGRGRAAGGATRKVLKDFGEHEGKPLQLLDGRYGPYVKHEKTNATVPKGTDPASLTKEDAVRLVEERRAKQAK